MSLPSFRGSAATTNGTAATASPVINLPASVSAGDTIFVVYRNAVAGAIGWPNASWNELFDGSPDASDDQFASAWKLADGTEGGTTITLTSANAKFAAVAWCVQNAIDPTLQAPTLSTVATGTSAGQPNATTCTPSGGSNDYLYLTFFGMEGEQTGITSYPTNYTLGQSGLANSGTGGAVTTNVTIAGAGFQKGLATAGAASEDAGAWTVAGTLDDWSAYTIAFYPKAIPVGSLVMHGLAASALLSVALGAGSVVFAGQVPDVINAGPGTTIQLPAGSLVFKGPQRVGSVTLTPGAGSVAWTGQALTVSQGQTVTPGAGAMAYAGLAPTLDITGATTIAMPAGSLAWHGLIPSLTVGDVFINIPAGSLVFKGPQRPDTVASIPVGVLNWTGYAPSAVVTPPGNISIPPGSLVWQGLAPERVAGRTASLGAGSLVFTGQYVAVAFKGLDAGSLVWHGLEPTVVVNTQGTIAIPAGSLTWHGLANVIGWSTGIPAGTLNFHGLAPQSGQTSSIAIGAGSLVFTGQTPVSIRDISIPLGVGRLIFTSDQGVIPHIDVVNALGAGVLAFTGQLPTVAIGVTDSVIAIPAGSELFTGYAPTLIPSVEIFPGAGSLVFAGQAPVVLNGLTVNLQAGALSFTGQVMNAQVLSPFLLPAGSLVWHGLRMTVRNTGVTGSGRGIGGYEYVYLYIY